MLGRDIFITQGGRACRQSLIWLYKKKKKKKERKRWKETMPVRRGCIIKDELVTISNRQTNWTTLGLPPGVQDAMSKTKSITEATSWDIKIMTIPAEESCVFHARNSATRYFRGFSSAGPLDRYCPIRIRSGSLTVWPQARFQSS